MDANLNLHTKLLAFSDRNINSNPRLRVVDWEREVSGIAVKDPDSRGHEIPVGSSKLIFDGVRSTAIDGTTTFSIDLLANDSSKYRITHTGGTNPAFKTGRGLTLNSCVLTFSVNANQTVNLSVPLLSPSDFTNVLANDVIFIPHTTTGDAANVISIMNSGYWQVLAKTNAQNIIIARLYGATFEGTSETVVLTSNSQIRAFSASGVQIGDTVVISAGFSTAAQKSYLVTAVTDLFVEFVSTLPIPDESNIIPTAAGMSFYTEAKNVLYIEADQECVIGINGDTGDYQKVSPIEPGNSEAPGIYLKWGPVYSLTVVNKSTSTLNILVVTAA
jgi:hypothetical protein